MLIAQVACTDAKNSDQFPSSVGFNDSHAFKRLIEDLDKNGIKYRKGKDNSVFFSSNDSEKVQAITSKIHTEYYPGCGAFSDEKSELIAIEDELQKQDIPFSVVELDHGPTITCLPKYQGALEQIVRSRGSLQKVPSQ